MILHGRPHPTPTPPLSQGLGTAVPPQDISSDTEGGQTQPVHWPL